MSKKEKINHPKEKGKTMVYSTVSLPASMVEDLKLLKEAYEETWRGEGERERVTYEKIFERLLSRSGLGHVDPDVYAEFTATRESRKKFPEVVKKATTKVVENLAVRASENGTSLTEEAQKEQERVKTELEASREKKKVMYYIHPDGRKYRAEMGKFGRFVPVNPGTGEYMKISSLGDGFVLQEMEV